MKFSTLIVIFISAAISGVTATLPAVENDVAELTTACKTLENVVKAFPATGGTVAEALIIRSTATGVTAIFDKAIVDLGSTPPLNDVDSARLHANIKIATEILIITLNLLVDKKPAFDKLLVGITPVRVYVLAELRVLGRSGSRFGGVALALVSAKVRPDALVLKGRAEVAYNNAVAVYSK